MPNHICFDFWEQQVSFQEENIEKEEKRLITLKAQVSNIEESLRYRNEKLQEAREMLKKAEKCRGG